MSVLIGFLVVCLEQDEAQALAALGRFAGSAPGSDLWDATVPHEVGPADVAACHSPHRWLADVVAKRRILALHAADGGHQCPPGVDGSGQITRDSGDCMTLCLMAQLYGRRPGFRAEWAL